MAEMSTGKRSYFAMVLSIIIPGLGQIHLRKPLKGFILFLGVISAGAIIYVNSLPVNTWRDLTRIDELEKSRTKDRLAREIEVDSGIQKPASENEPPKEERSYHLYTLEDKLLFRMRLEFQSDLEDGKAISEGLWQVFRGHKILLSENATILIKKNGSQWLINDSYQTYVVKKKVAGLDVYAVKKLMFRPSWKFRISGLIQLLVFWGYAILDGWRGQRGFNDKRALKKKFKEMQERREADE